MSRYYRRRGNNGMLALFIAILCIAAVVLGAVFHTELGEWAKKVKEKFTEEEASAEDWEDFYFERASMRFDWGSEVNGEKRGISYSCVFSEDKYSSIGNNAREESPRSFPPAFSLSVYLKKGIEVR